MSKFAFVFPGQGSQSLGMLGDFMTHTDIHADIHTDIIKTTFATASAMLDFDLWELTQTDPQATLNQTEYTQPALLTASVAIWRLWLDKQGAIPSYLAGHSLGEYSALVCAQALNFADAVKLVNLRGQYMQAAVPSGSGAMAAILGLTDEQVNQVCLDSQKFGIVTPANINSPGQIVIAGEKGAVQQACVLAKAQGALKTIELAVSVPSHCPLMLPAAERLKTALNHILLQPPKIPVINNVAVQIETDPDKIKAALVSQLVAPVQWVKTIQKIAAFGLTHVIECGPGNVLTGLGKRIDASLEYLNLSTYSNFETCLTAESSKS